MMTFEEAARLVFSMPGTGAQCPNADEVAQELYRREMQFADDFQNSFVAGIISVASYRAFADMRSDGVPEERALFALCASSLCQGVAIGVLMERNELPEPAAPGGLDWSKLSIDPERAKTRQSPWLVRAWKGLFRNEK